MSDEYRIIRRPADWEPGLRVSAYEGRFVIEHWWPGGPGEVIVIEGEDYAGLIEALAQLADENEKG